MTCQRLGNVNPTHLDLVASLASTTKKVRPHTGQVS